LSERKVQNELMLGTNWS